MTKEEIIEYLRDKKRIRLRQDMDWGCKKNGMHISVYYVDSEGLWQIAYHNIQGDVVLTELEIWVKDDWEEVETEIPNMWYFPPYVDRVVHEMTTYRPNELNF